MIPSPNHWSKARPLHFQIGLALSLALTLFAFEWKTEYIVPTVNAEVVETFQTEVIENLPPITQQFRKPPPPPTKTVITDTFEEVPDETLIEEVEIELPELLEPDEDVSFLLEGEEVGDLEEEEAFVIMAEEMAQFKGGMPAFYEYLRRHLKYPSKAKRMGIEGKVFVRFIINKDGTLSNVETVRGIGAGCDEEAERVLKESPHWKPGYQQGHAVRVQMVVPIHFKLN